MPVDPGVLLPEILTCMLVAPGFKDGPCRSDPIVTLYGIGGSVGDLHLFSQCSKSSISKTINILQNFLSCYTCMTNSVAVHLLVFPLIYRVPAPYD